MLKIIIRVLNILVVGLVAGTIFGILVGYNPNDLSAGTYIEQQQSVIIALNTLMPLLGLLAIVLTITSAFLQKKNKNVFIIMLMAAGFLILSGLTTRFGNQPINSVVMTWDVNTPPSNWMQLRDQWWLYHIIRTMSALIAFFLVTWSNINKA
jgi:hypothetical protein